MIVKRIWDKDQTIQWWECDFVVRFPKNDQDSEKFILYKDDHKKGEILCSEKTDSDYGFTIYFLENGKTVDTYYYKPNKKVKS